MSEQNVTGIASFGGKSVATGAMIVAEIDGAMHLDGEGQERSAFLPGEPVYFLLHHDPEVKIVRIRTTDDGEVQRIGQVTRTRTQELSFDHPAHLIELAYRPSGQPTAKWYGRHSNLFLSGLSLQADLAPCLGEISYPIKATQYLHRPGSGLVLQPGEAFPVDLKIEYKLDE
jgi:hypothetical protein